LAVVDQHDHAIVISVVYDGPPEAGKTTSVRALARSFGREVYTPEEQNGRTVFFDWLEHTGGRFDGAPIRCQIVSVPGQKRWGRRRLHFIAQADVVVFVGDTSGAAWTETQARLDDLRTRLDAREGPPVGVVFQANRRDAADAVPMAVVRERVGAARTAIVESVALDGTGVREAFVFAVRLALDRVREEQQRGALPRSERRPGGDDLLEVLRRIELDTVDTGPESPSRAATEAVRVRIPSQDAPSGFVWPPVEGRIVLREATLAGHEAREDPNGDLEVDVPGWRVHSAAAAVFADLDEARDRLIAWARLHASAHALLSKRRCVVLTETGDGHWRLWQLVRDEPSLRALFVDGFVEAGPQDVARRIASAGYLLSEAQAACAKAMLPLRCSLDTIGVSDIGRPMFVDLMPHPARQFPRPTAAEDVARDLASLLRGRPADEVAQVRHAVQFTHPTELGPAGDTRIWELLSGLLAT
jgi:signal recognition particle receptor subunit beta